MVVTKIVENLKKIPAVKCVTENLSSTILQGGLEF